jgi:UDP-N-acetylglucosamine--N-acetylmuramyl-(pentapeptide) pyrophosphoryl-undecaprenol N-acetylglucosamine transferase
VPFKVLASLRKASAILKKFKPDVAIGFGGYASGPLLRQAARAGIPTIIQEQNSYAGITNRLLSKSAKKICVSYDGMEKYFPDDKIVKTGNPVRDDIIHLNGSLADPALKFFGIQKDIPVILVLGGSLGARSINNGMLNSLQKVRDQKIQVIWQTGKIYYREMIQKTRSLDLENVKILEYIRRMDYAYTLADVIVSRAGALSISELEIVGKPVIFIPSPNVAEDHQTKNAMRLVEKNAAWMIPNDEGEKDILGPALELVNDTARRKELSENIRREAIPDATARIVKQIKELVA